MLASGASAQNVKGGTMSLTWSFDSERGGRTTDEIIDKSKLAKSSKNCFNCCRPPLFSFIPMKRVVIDSLHLFSE